MNNNIKDVTNSPEDWEDFWNSESEGKEFKEQLPAYVKAVLGQTQYPAEYKRDSPLSE